MPEMVGVPLYQQIKEDIKAAIQSGKYQPKQQIPPEPALSEEYSVSRVTVRRAVEELCSEGYLTKMQGRGTFVNAPRIHRKLTASARLESFTRCCAANGMTAGARVLDRKIVPARTDEHEFLQIPENELLLYIQRLRTADGLPVFLENVFLPYQPYRELMTAPLEDVSIFETIARVSGRRVADAARSTVEVTRASVEQAQRMGIAVGEPLFYVNGYFVDQDGAPLCIGRQYYIGSRYMFEF